MMNKTLAASLVLLAFTGSASAQSVYLGAGVTQGKMSVSSVSGNVGPLTYSGSADKTTDTGYKVFGGFNFTKNWGLELGYNDFGNGYTFRGDIGATPFSIGDGKVDNVYLAATGTLPLSNDFALFAKAGVARNRVSIGPKCISSLCLTVGSTSRSQAMYGLGASYAFTKSLGVQLEYEDYGKLSGDDFWGTGASGAVKVSAVAASMKLSF